MSRGTIDLKLTSVLRKKFSDVYCDHLNLYYNEKAYKLDPDLSLQALLKDKLRIPEKPLFDQWILEQYPDMDLIEAISAWQRKLIETARPNPFSTHLKILKQVGVVHFYKSSGVGNQVSFICDTNDTVFLKKLHAFFVWEIQDKHLRSMPPCALKTELFAALDEDIIPQIDKIVNFSNDPNKYCLACMEIDKLPEGETPAWDSFLYQFKREIYRELFMAWVYSVFKDDNFGRQLCWINGMGKTGKSTAMSVIRDYLQTINSELTRTIEDTWREDKFSLAAYKNCRLALVANNINRGLLRRITIQNLTGNDPVTIRKMCKENESAVIYSKVLVCSNYPPFVHVHLEHEISRILYLELDNQRCYAAANAWKRETDGEWNVLLKVEFLMFLKKCEPYYYKHLAPDGHNFKIYPEMLEDISIGASDIKESMDAYWEYHWVKDENAGVTTINTIFNDFVRFMEDTGKNKKSLFRSYLYTKIRELQIDIKELGVGKTHYIVGWKKTGHKATLQGLITRKVNQINKELGK